MPNPGTPQKEDRQTHTVALMGGLNTITSSLLLGSEKMNGYAIRLINMEPFKGYKRLAGFEQFKDLVNLEGSTRVCGIAVHNSQVFVSKIVQVNALAYSEEIDNAAWTKSGGTVSADATTSPFTTTVADFFYESAASVEHFLSQTITKTASTLPYVGSIFVKAAGTRNRVKLTLDDGGSNGISAVYDLSAAAFITSVATFGTGFSAISLVSGATSYGSGWYRVHVGDVTNNSASLRLKASLYTTSDVYLGDGASGMYFFGGKIENASTVGAYTKTSTAVLTGTRYDTFRRSLTDTMWNRITDESLSIATTGKVRLTEYNFLGTETITFTDGTNDARRWDGTTLTAVTAGSNTGPKYATTYRNRLVLSGFSNYPNLVSVSVPNDDTNYSGAAGAIDLNFGGVVTAVRAFRQKMFMFGETRIKTLIGTNRDDFIIDDVSGEMGCTAPDSLVEIGGDLYYWSTDGIRPISATADYGDVNLGTISVPIRPTLVNALESDQYDTRDLVSVVVRNKSQVRYFFSKSDAASDDDVPGLLFSLNSTGVDNNPDNAHWEFAELIGINPSCCASGYIGGKEYVMHGGFDGIPYRQETGTTFGTRNILTVYQSPHMDIGDPEIRKTLHKLRLYLDILSDTTLYVSVIYDYGTEESSQPANYQLNVDYNSAIYNDSQSIYDNADTLYSQNTSPVQLSLIEGSGKTISLRVVCIDAGSEYNVHGLTLDYAIEGRE